MSSDRIEKRIRWSGLLVVAGLVIQIFTMFWTHPLAFMCFILVGCPLVAAGMVLYLFSLVTHHST